MNAYDPQAYTIPGVDARQTEMVPRLHLAPVGDKAVDLAFDGGLLSSDAGLMLLKDPDEQRGFTRALAAVLKDPRDPRRVHFTLHEASQPTLSRFENHISRTELSRMARVLVDQCIASYARPPQRIVLDFDDTEDPVHGEQEQARYDGYYGGYCFLPLHLSEGLSGRLITTIFKAKRFTGTQLLSVLKRLVKRLRHAWPDTLVIFRGDSHCASPEVMPWIEAQAHLSSVTGLTSNAVLQPLAREVVEQAKRAYERDGGKITRFHSTRYQAGTWSRSRRVVIKVEGSAQGVKTRFVVTDMEHARTKVLYQHMYCARGQAENESKDHKRSLKSDRTSCHRFEAKQCRLLMHSAAYVFLDTLRREVFKTAPWACATMATIQLHVLKLGARVQELTDRIKISLPSSCPVAPLLRRSLTL